MNAGLEFHTTQELVDELLRRKTFLGVIIHAENGCRGDWLGEKIFKVHFNSNLGAEQAARLMDTVAEYMDRYNSE